MPFKRVSAHIKLNLLCEQAPRPPPKPPLHNSGSTAYELYPVLVRYTPKYTLHYVEKNRKKLDFTYMESLILDALDKATNEKIRYDLDQLLWSIRLEGFVLRY